MTDYFILLQQPRGPWLDLEQLKQKYHELTLARHPDRALADADRREADSFPYSFAEITEAYRVLADPKLRLQHLLKLQDYDAPADSSIPADLLDLFSRIGNFFQATDGLLQKSQATQNALARSLLQPEILAARREAEDILGQVRVLHHDAIAQTRALNESWSEALPAVALLSRRLAYLTRWIQQLKERQFQLSSNR
jgi:DnaJ-domain-containing protein 1